MPVAAPISMIRWYRFLSIQYEADAERKAAWRRARLWWWSPRRSSRRSPD